MIESFPSPRWGGVAVQEPAVGTRAVTRMQAPSRTRWKHASSTYVRPCGDALTNDALRGFDRVDAVGPQLLARFGRRTPGCSSPNTWVSSFATLFHVPFLLAQFGAVAERLSDSSTHSTIRAGSKRGFMLTPAFAYPRGLQTMRVPFTK